MRTHLLEVTTGSRVATDLTSEVLDFCAMQGDGLCTVFVPHATAGVALFETGSGTEQDLEQALEALLPRSASYRHRHGSPGHGRDHVLPALISPSVTIPVVAGRPLLGTWQSIVLVDPNVDNPSRRVWLTFLADPGSGIVNPSGPGPGSR